MAKIVVMAMAVLLLACKPNDNPTQTTTEQSLAQETFNQIIPTHPILKNQTITFQRQMGNYPLLIDTAYQAVNDDIAKFIDGLVEFDKQFDKDEVSGVDFLEYLVLTPNDDVLSIRINYGVTDFTLRSFGKFYSIDLKNHEQITLKEYLSHHQINVAKINENINQFLKECHSDNQPIEQCNDPSLYYIPFGWNDDDKIDVLEHHTGFYIIDKDHISIAFDSAKFTTSFKINIHNYQIETN